MNNFTKIAFTLLSTFAVSSIFAQCQPGSPCSYQQGGYQQDGYQQEGYQQGGYRSGNYQQQPRNQSYYNRQKYQSTNSQGSTQQNPGDSRRVGATFYGERPTQNPDGTMTHQGYPVYMDSTSQVATQDPNGPRTGVMTPTDPNAMPTNPYSTQQPTDATGQRTPSSQPSSR